MKQKVRQIDKKHIAIIFVLGYIVAAILGAYISNGWAVEGIRNMMEDKNLYFCEINNSINNNYNNNDFIYYNGDLDSLINNNLTPLKNDIKR